MPDGLHGPELCNRPCSVCADENGVSHHHWYEAFAGDPDDPDDEYTQHEASVVFGEECWFICKHCTAWATCEYVWAL